MILNETTITGKVLFVGAHPDDIEIGCGGTAAKCVQRGNVIAFAIATRESDQDKAKRREAEARKAAKLLDLSEDNGGLFFGNLPDTQLNLKHPELRRWLEAVYKRFEADTVFIHREDTHTDHEAIYKVATGLFQKWEATILLYKIRRPSPDTAFNPNHVEDITGFIRKKIAMCKCHASQRALYIGNDSVKTNAHQCYLDWYGMKNPIKHGFAEDFFIHSSRSSDETSSETQRLTVPYSLRLVRERNRSLRWKD